jgi:hypothetical protein
MAKMIVVYEWNGEPASYRYPNSLSVDDTQKKIQDLCSNGFLNIPSAQVSLDDDCPRTIYIIPFSRVYRFIVELEQGEKCPEPHD